MPEFSFLPNFICPFLLSAVGLLSSEITPRVAREGTFILGTNKSYWTPVAQEPPWLLRDNCHTGWELQVGGGGYVALAGPGGHPSLG